MRTSCSPRSIRTGSLLTLLVVWIPITHAAEISAVQTANGPVFAWTQFAGPATNSSTVGWQFQATGPNLTVDALGFFDSGGNGLGNSHQVGLWDNNGNLLAQTTIPAGTTASLVGSYRYESIAPITLTAGSAYVMGALMPPNDADSLIALSSQTYSDVTFLQSRQTILSSTASFAFPNVNAGVSDGVFGPNLLFNVPDAQPTGTSAVQTANGPVFAWTQFAGPATNSSMVGWQFQVSGSDLSVDALGFFDDGGDGLGSSHQVGIWDNNGNLLVQIVIPSGTGATLDGDYRYESISPITLTAGSTYVMGALMPPNDADSLIALSSQTFSGVSFLQSRQTILSSTASFAFPNVDAGVSDGVFGPNFKFVDVAAPEPASISMFALGALVLLTVGLRMRNSSRRV
jgi:hypothetical protein